MENLSVIDIVANGIVWGCVVAFVGIEVVFLDGIGLLKPALVAITLIGLAAGIAEQHAEQMVRYRYRGRVR